MPAPENRLKRALLAGECQYGLWLDLGSDNVAEMAARAGFDWCLVDAEHGPNDLARIEGQLRAIAAGGAEAVVRVPVGQDWILKRVLDMGAQTVLVPMIDTAGEAAAMARAVRYPPHGNRGVAAAVARCSGWNLVPDYAANADAEVCLLVQAESRRAIANLDAILATEGVDGVFVGPADLAADMGYLDQPDAPAVRAVIDDAIGRIAAAGKIAGIIAFTPEDVARHAENGARFLGVGADAVVLSSALAALLGRIRGAG